MKTAVANPWAGGIIDNSLVHNLQYRIADSHFVVGFGRAHSLRSGSSHIRDLRPFGVRT